MGRCEYAGCRGKAKYFIFTVDQSGHPFTISACNKCYGEYEKAMKEAEK